MIDNKKIVGIARSWIGTPYHHQESVKGEGCDCLGLLRGVWREFYEDENPEEIPNYSPSWGDHRTDDPLMAVAKKYFSEQEKTKNVDNLIEGSLILFRMRRNLAVKHCAIVSGPRKMIHAYNLHNVREDIITDWWMNKLAGVFTFRDTK